MNLNWNRQLACKIGQGLLFFPAGMIADADFGNAVALNQVRDYELRRAFKNEKILSQILQILL